MVGSGVCCRHSSLSSLCDNELNKHSSPHTARGRVTVGRGEYKRIQTNWDYWWVKILYLKYWNVIISVFQTFRVFRRIPASSCFKVRRWIYHLMTDEISFNISASSSSLTTRKTSKSSTSSVVCLASGTSSLESYVIAGIAQFLFVIVVFQTDWVWEMFTS